MLKESDKPLAEEIASRIRPVRAILRSYPAWLTRPVVRAAALAAAVLAGILFMTLRDSGFARRRADFAPLPQLNAAIVAAQEKLKANPQDIATLVELGTLHFEKGKEYYADGINELEEARELGALDTRIFYCLGIMYQEVGLYAFALEEYKRFLRHYPEDKEIRMLVAKLLYKQGGFAEAVAEYERLKFHHSGDSLIEENLGLSLWGAKELDRAIESFNQLRGMGDEQAKRAAFYLGQIAYEKGDAKAALEHFLNAQPQPDAPDFGIPPERARAALATAYQKLGRLPEAKAAWELVLADSPNDAKAKAAIKDINRRLPKTSSKKK